MLTEHGFLFLRDIVASSLKNRALRKMLLDAAAVVGVGPTPTTLSAERMTQLLASIEPLLGTRSSSVGGYGADWLWALAAFHEAARVRLIELFRTLGVDGRLRIVQDLTICSPRWPERIPTQLHLLRSGLRDASKRVRRFAADRAGGSPFVELATDLDAAIRAEQDQHVLDSLRCSRDLLTQGYFAREGSPGAHGRDFWIILKPGHMTFAERVPVSLINEVGEAELIRRYRARHRSTPRLPGGDFDPLPVGEAYAVMGRWPLDWTKELAEADAEDAARMNSARYAEQKAQLEAEWAEVRRRREARESAAEHR